MSARATRPRRARGVTGHRDPTAATGSAERQCPGTARGAGSNPYHQPGQQRDRDPVDRTIIHDPGRINKHQSAFVDTLASRRNQHALGPGLLSRARTPVGPGRHTAASHVAHRLQGSRRMRDAPSLFSLPTTVQLQRYVNGVAAGTTSGALVSCHVDGLRLIRHSPTQRVDKRLATHAGSLVEYNSSITGRE